MSFEEAKREATPVVISVAGRSGSGKTYSSLLLARGLAGPTGKVGVIDSENKRSRMYADDPAIGGFVVSDLYPPYTSDAYIRQIDEAEKTGVDVLVIDSMSHEWTGIGGAIEQADAINAKSRKPGPTAWIKPKVNHRRLVNRLLAAQCHVICCLRAEHKMIAYMDNGEQKFAESEHLIPEQEKRFIYEMTLSATLDNVTHLPVFTKCPKPLLGALEDGKLIGRETGEIIRTWVDGGAPVDKEVERMLATLRDIASWKGRAGMEAHWKAHVTKALSPRLKPHLAAILAIADETDRTAAEAEPEPDPIDEGDQGLDLG